MTKAALAGVKVFDISWVVVGPIITKYLADFGAIVVRIESGTRPDPIRMAAPYKDGISDVDHCGYFPLFNSNKYEMALNLNNPEGVQIAKRLIKWSDIVVEGFAPGVMSRWGLEYKEVKKINPKAIMVSASTHGQTGPHATQPSYGNLLVGYTGFTAVTGWPDRAPVQPFGAYNDSISPYFAVAALVAALDYRRRTGKGQYLDFSEVECSLQFMSTAILDYTANHRLPVRKGNACDCAAPHGVYRCQGDDRWCAITVYTDAEWQSLCRVVNRPELLDAKFSTILSRKRNEDELNKIIEEWTCNLTPEQVMHDLQNVGVPAGLVENNRDLFEDPQLKHRQHFWRIKHPILGSYPHPGQASKLSKTPAEPRMPAPCLGEHTEFVCREILKMSDEEFIRVLESGAFE